MIARKISTQLMEQFSSILSMRSSPPNSNSDLTMTAKADVQASNEFRSLTLVAQCPDPEEFEADVFKLTDSLGHISVEESTYYNVLRGELKLRITYQKQNQSYGELIAYKRTKTDIDGVYLAEGSIAAVQDVSFLNNTLKLALPELGNLKSKRRVFATQKITIHLDEIEDLGTYIQIDIALSSSEPSQEELTLMSELQCSLKIKPSHLIPHSYLELFRQRKSSDSGVDEESSD